VRDKFLDLDKLYLDSYEFSRKGAESERRLLKSLSSETDKGWLNLGR
jgi:hypothetical protein